MYKILLQEIQCPVQSWKSPLINTNLETSPLKSSSLFLDINSNSAESRPHAQINGSANRSKGTNIFHIEDAYDELMTSREMSKPIEEPLLG